MGLDNTIAGPDHQTQGWKEHTDADALSRFSVVNEEETLSEEAVVESSIGAVEPLKRDYQPSVPNAAKVG